MFIDRDLHNRHSSGTKCQHFAPLDGWDFFGAGL